jgi:hypothetical protein
MSGPYKKCHSCEGPGVTCRVCPLEREEQDDGEETMELVTCGSDHGDVTGWVKVKNGGGDE